MQEVCQRKNLAKSLIKVLRQVSDYDLHSNIYKALSMLVLSTSLSV
jgi:metal-sulfur cluster biosynthetic enzyme